MRLAAHIGKIGGFALLIFAAGVALGPTAPKQEMNWEPHGRSTRVAENCKKRVYQPIYVDFTARWCVNLPGE